MSSREQNLQLLDRGTKEEEQEEEQEDCLQGKKDTRSVPSMDLTDHGARSHENIPNKIKFLLNHISKTGEIFPLFLAVEGAGENG
jgi:hypothetical protein